MEIKNRIYAVLFDMDGVLVDSYEAHYLSWTETCVRRGASMPRELYARLFGRSFYGFLEEMGASDISPEEARAWRKEKEYRYREIIEANFPENDGASELLRDLRQEGFRLGLASSGPRENVDCLFRHLRHAECLQYSVSANETTHAKPHPEAFLYCAEKLGVPPAQCAVVEDSIYGLLAARAAGMTVIGLTGTATAEQLQPYADRVTSSLRQLNGRLFREWIEEAGRKYPSTP